MAEKKILTLKKVSRKEVLTHIYNNLMSDLVTNEINRTKFMRQSTEKSENQADIMKEINFAENKIEQTQKIMDIVDEFIDQEDKKAKKLKN